MDIGFDYEGSEQKSVITGLNHPGCCEYFRKTRLLEQKPTRKVFQPGRNDGVDKDSGTARCEEWDSRFTLQVEHGGIAHALGVGCETMRAVKVLA